MSEYIQNGDFSSGFDYWINGPGSNLAFILDAGTARAQTEWPGNTTYRYQMYQSFSVSDEVIAANIWTWCKWICHEGTISDGWVKFWVDLKKPDSTWVGLLSETWNGPSSGEGYRLNGDDIKSHFTQQGTYHLYLTCEVCPTAPPTYFSTGWYDNISLKISVKKYKTVIEKLAMAGTLGKGTTHEELEVVKFSETLDKIRCKILSEQVKFGESTFKKVKKTVLEVVKFAGSYVNSGFKFKEVSEAVKFTETLTPKLFGWNEEAVGFSESLSAKKTAGNVETSIQITDLIEWIPREKVKTKWVKKKVEII